jgi:hypothetical protein
MFGGIPMVSKKKRRHSGYVTPRSDISKKDLIKYDLFVDIFYDDWDDWRDGFRDWFWDFKLIKKINPSVCYFDEEMYEKRIRMNKKQKKLLKRKTKQQFQPF